MKVCIFCGASSGKESEKNNRWAFDLGAYLAMNGLELVYGGASVGLMGALAEGFLSQEAKVYGVIPKSLMRVEMAHDKLTKLYRVETMHERKQLMYDLSDVFLALPGGYGTLDELFEIVTWSQLEFHRKPCFVFNHQGFFRHLMAHFNHLEETGFITRQHLHLMQILESKEEFIQKLKKE